MTHAIAALIQVLVAVFGAHALWTLRRAGCGFHRPGASLALLGTAFFCACALAFLPALVAVRNSNILVQPAWILAMVAIALLLHASPAVRRFFDNAALDPLLALFGWRVIFGMLLAASWHAGGLPSAFAIPAAVGDVVAGLWALILLRALRLGHKPSRLHLHVWNVVGLADLVNVMRLAVTVLVPWLTSHPELPQFPLLPLFGVPVFIGLHLHLWRTIETSRTSLPR